MALIMGSHCGGQQTRRRLFWLGETVQKQRVLCDTDTDSPVVAIDDATALMSYGVCVALARTLTGQVRCNDIY